MAQAVLSQFGRRMSDYLTSLVARTLHLEPVVQPRPASLFEPLSVAGPEAAAPLRSESMFEDSGASELAAEVSPSPLLKQNTPQPVTLNATPATARIEEKATNAAGTTNRSTEGFIQAQPIAATVLPQPALYGTNPESTPYLSIDEASTQSVNRNLTDSLGESGNNRVRLQVTPEVKLSSRAHDHQQNQATLITPGPVLANTALGNPPSRRDSTHTSHATSAEGPETVVVTIGRVDVRAIFAPPTAAPQSNRQRPQPMSLDEYLKRRSEGGR